jgi:hypothetical protein
LWVRKWSTTSHGIRRSRPGWRFDKADDPAPDRADPTIDRLNTLFSRDTVSFADGPATLEFPC